MNRIFVAAAVSSLALAACGERANDGAASTTAVTADATPGMAGDGTADAAPGTAEGVGSDGTGTTTSNNGLDAQPSNTMNPSGEGGVAASKDGRGTSTGISAPVATGAQAAAMTPPKNAQDYVNMAASGDQYEIQSSQLVLDQSKNAGVRRFAQMMIDDHRAASQKMMAAVRNAKLQMPPTALSPKHQTQIAGLRAAGTQNIDQVYLSQQRGAHAESTALHQAGTGMSGLPDALKAHAREALPKVQMHARMLQDIKPGTNT